MDQHLSRSILLVDDEPLIRVVLSDLLADAGFRVSEVESADQATEHLQELGQVDLLITDVRMPGEMDGLALARWARKHCPGTKIIIISGYVQSDESRAIGDFDAYLRKPFVPERLIQVATGLMPAP
jgi:CheY-like chemotaxis protein